MISGAITREALAYFERAAASGVVERTLVIGGASLRLRFAGEALVARVWPAIAHLESGVEGRADLTAHLWDAESTGVGMSPSPWYPLELGPGGYVPAAAEVGLHVHCRIDTGMVTMLDAATGLAFSWVPGPASWTRYEAAAPLRQILSSWFAKDGRCVTHSAAVGRGGRGVLIGGRSGSGKSTTALLCLQAGFDYAGDDYVLVDTSAEAAYVHGMYATGKVLGSGLGRVPELVGAFEMSGGQGLEDEKAIAYLAGHGRGALSRGFALCALVLPLVVGGRDSRLVRVPGAAGLRGLAPSTVFQHGGGGVGMFPTLARLAQRLPCYRLELGTDVAQIPRLLAALIDSNGVAT